MTSSLPTTAPPPQPFRPLAWPNPKPVAWKGSIPLWAYTPSSPITTCMLAWPGGSWYEPSPGSAQMTCRMLDKGTPNQNAQQLARAFSQCGAHLFIHAYRDYTSLTLKGLTASMPAALHLLKELLQKACFPPSAWQTTQSKLFQEIALREANPSEKAHRLLRERVFGPHHPYGRTLTAEQVERTALGQLQAHHQAGSWQAAQCFWCGPLEEKYLTPLVELFQAKSSPASQPSPAYQVAPVPGRLDLQDPTRQQATLHMGLSTLSIDHPDYHALYLTNILLGGYFGSRLMNHLRSQKGYTYGISSRLVPYAHGTYWHVGAELRAEHAQQARQAIYQELTTLQTTRVPAEELAQVITYLRGALMARFDDPFLRMAHLPALYLQGKDYTFYQGLDSYLARATPEEIQEAAQRYLVIDQMAEVMITP